MKPTGGLGAIVPGRVWKQLTQAGNEKVYQPSEMLLSQGDSAPYVLVLISGQVKVSREDADRNTLVLAVRGPGEILGELALLDGDSRSATVTATEICVTRKVMADEFTRFVDEHDMKSALLCHAIRRYREADVRAELAFLRSGPRVARGLLYLVSGLYSDETTPLGHVDIRLEHSELGLVVNLSRSTVSTHLGKLRDLKVIEIHRGRIVVTDVKRIRAICENDDVH